MSFSSEFRFFQFSCNFSHFFRIFSIFLNFFDSDCFKFSRIFSPFFISKFFGFFHILLIFRIFPYIFNLSGLFRFFFPNFFPNFSGYCPDFSIFWTFLLLIFPYFCLSKAHVMWTDKHFWPRPWNSGWPKAPPTALPWWSPHIFILSKLCSMTLKITLAT